MNAAFAAFEILAEATPSPTPSIMPDDFTPATVTPGLPGFFVFFFLAVAVVLLGIDMSRRIRRATARETVRQRMDSGSAAGASAHAPGSSDSAPSAGASASPAE